jgi:hypothetical protein
MFIYCKQQSTTETGNQQWDTELQNVTDKIVVGSYEYGNVHLGPIESG